MYYLKYLDDCAADEKFDNDLALHDVIINNKSKKVLGASEGLINAEEHAEQVEKPVARLETIERIRSKVINHGGPEPDYDTLIDSWNVKFSKDSKAIWRDDRFEKGSLRKKVIVKGSGIPVRRRQVVDVQYILFYKGEDEIEEWTNLDNPLRYRVGCNQVRFMLELAVRSMEVGETSLFLGSPLLGTGPRRRPGTELPLNETLRDDGTLLLLVEVLKCKTIDRIKSNPMGPKMVIRNGFEYNCAIIEKIINDGNEKYMCGLYNVAKRRYKSALICVRDLLDPQSPPDFEKYYTLRCSLSKNLCMTNYMMHKVPQALRHAKMAANFSVSNHLQANANYWSAKCLFSLGLHEEAFQYINTARALNTDDEHTHKLYNKLRLYRGFYSLASLVLRINRNLACDLLRELKLLNEQVIKCFSGNKELKTN